MIDLPIEVAKVYEITETVPGQRFITRPPLRIEVDLKKVTMNQAKRLAKMGYLKEKTILPAKDKPKKTVKDGDNE